jgi:hypothetical protein
MALARAGPVPVFDKSAMGIVLSSSQQMMLTMSSGGAFAPRIRSL